MSEIFARWKINTTSCCVNDVYTLPPKLSSVIKKFGSGSIFCVFTSVTSILIGKDDEYEKNGKNAYKNFRLSVQWPLRSLHTESENFVRNFHTLKNKYNLTLCQSRLHTASEIFVHHKTIRIRFDFSVASILRGVLTVQSHRTSERQNPEWRLSSSSTSSRSTKHRKDPCTLSSSDGTNGVINKRRY